jgi:hypothetical protein
MCGCKYCLEASLLLPQLWDRLVRVMKDRPEHHGLKHALDVANGALELSKYEVRECHKPLMYAVGLLHDVSDHKFPQYVADLQYVIAVCSDELQKILHQLTSAVSLSGEISRGVIVPREYMVLRDYVSDADKLTGLGVCGFIRMLEYSLDTHKHSDSQSLANELRECFDRRMRLVPQYIRTQEGRKHVGEAFAELESCVGLLCG